jgi:hypothetical protein
LLIISTKYRRTTGKLGGIVAVKQDKDALKYVPDEFKELYN